MRLIDADALSQNVIALGKTGDSYDPEVLNFRIGYNSALLAVKKLIANAPTLDVQPVRRGEWKMMDEHCNHAHEFRCTQCRRSVFYDHYTRCCDYDFCPNCGADMRKEEHAHDD